MKTWTELKKIQPLASKIITNSIKKDRISHAYLIQGARGTGKEALATLIAKNIFCKSQSGLEPCQECRECKRIDSGNHPDVHWIEPEGQSIKIEQVKSLQKEFTYSGLESNKKVYIVKDADTLTLNAANRILKFLEEPSRQTTAMMLTENSQSIIPTIRSRCQVIDLKPLHPIHLQKQLKESGMSEQNATLMSALTNDLDDAFERSNDEWFAEGRKLMIQLMEKLSGNSDDAYLFLYNHWLKHFSNREQMEQGIDLAMLGFKDILYAHIEKNDAMVMFQPNDKRLQQLVMSFSEENLIHILHSLLQAKRHLKRNVNPTLVMEQLTLQIKR